ncbi:hypothetical protein BOTNAR_0228g00030 [Botryotinia narcissicola]|uniref:Major facilitator superfamily (MFS) profile domain-containing protein n=1 Tax=Botryotinia narcissicola TaxID=278944 RepID=A0A4Z1IHR7_9HELO|nr:hypothetical protein BOTNAR_0228g00030 [Botryotinia narcissicola]
MREDTQQVEDTGVYAKFSSVVLIAIALCLATFCVAVDNTITSTAVAWINQDFHSIDDVGWYAAHYTHPCRMCSATPATDMEQHYWKYLDCSRGRKNTSISERFRNQVARFDLAGTLTFMSATIYLLLALAWGGITYAWGSARIVALITLAGVLFCSFFGIEYWMKNSALIPLRLLRRRSIIAAIWFGLCLGGVNVFYIPLWFQIVDGVSVIKSSIIFIPFMISVFGDFMFAGFGTAATGYYTPFVYAGSIIMSIGTGLLVTVLSQYTSRAKWVGFQILIGAGIGLGEEQGLYMTFGRALFVSVAQAMFLENISKALKTVAPNLDPHSVLDGAMTSFPGGSSTQISAELQTVYGIAIK